MTHHTTDHAEGIHTRLLQAATEARTRAHAPYSRFHVGAALLIQPSGEIVTGCNVENASFGATICAERVAVTAAVSRYGADALKAGMTDLLVITEADPPAVPCALCLQVLAEFCSPALRIHLANREGVQQSMTLQELLPHPFTAF